MSLPAGFQFSQSSLQDYVECARRFELRYVKRLQWPAVEAEPIDERERHLQQGAAFHHMVHQHLLGVPAETLTASLPEADERLRSWWQGYLAADFVNELPPRRHPEFVLSAALAGHRLIAKYDLLAVEPGDRAVIVDWKTSLRKTPRADLEKRLQTVIYRYLLARAGSHLNGGEPIAPERAEMIYWFAGAPDEAELFSYSQSEYEQDEQYLTELIQTTQAQTLFELTSDEWRCRFCTYRSLCQRGIGAGEFDEDAVESTADSDDLDLDFDFDQIAEVEF
jgi:predicted RecB family nuclease